MPSDYSFNFDKIESVFFPLAFKRASEAAHRKQRFVHYSSAESAYAILNGSQVWMRKATAMNDFREIDYGVALLQQARTNDKFSLFLRALDGIFCGFQSEFENKIDCLLRDLPKDTFVTSLSEHDDSEDDLGRLSMWRAYGGSTGVALVVDGLIFTQPSSALKSLASPVAYLHPHEFDEQFDAVVHSIKSNIDFANSLGRDMVMSIIIQVCRSAIVCVKHPGFREEREWRLVYAPSLGATPVISPAIECVKGVPQLVQKIQLRDDPSLDYFGSIKTLFNRLIIGPTQFPNEMKEAFIQILERQGVTDPADKIVISQIPLRK